jgi:hypothetical protein
VVENIADIDKVSLIKQLKHEFWAFPQILGWKIPHYKYKTKEPSTSSSSSSSSSSFHSSSESFHHSSSGYDINLFVSENGFETPKKQSNSINIAVPSDAVNGNFLGAINTSLNILEKHYLDRDLQRTGNSIVVLSAGCGIFKVRPNLAQITKQRMLDSAFGIDFISLSRPPLHVVPLFIVSSPVEGSRDFYEMPHWMRVSYIDCKRPNEL